MLHTGTAGPAPAAGARARRWTLEDLTLFWARLRHRKPDAFEAWLYERDMTLIIAALLRLHDRQLRRIGMSRATLALDVEMLAIETARSQKLGHEALELVGGTAIDAAPASRAARQAQRPMAVAAE